VTRLVPIEEGTINHERYIHEILPIALKDGRKLMGNKFTFQQNSAPAHKDHFYDFWPTSR
jgi:hypothetical protein